MRLRTLASLIASVLLAAGCGAITEPARHDPFSPEGLATGVDGTVRWNGIEGGFWTVRLEDGRVLDPHETLPAGFRVEGLRVRLSAEVLSGRLCFHQAGLIVAVTDIRER